MVGFRLSLSLKGNCIMTARERFTADYGMPAAEVESLCTLASLAKECNEGFSNGDPHEASTDPKNKAENARCWEREVDKATERIAKLVSPYGFTGIEYTGLRPCLKRGDQFVEIPA